MTDTIASNGAKIEAMKKFKAARRWFYAITLSIGVVATFSLGVSSSALLNVLSSAGVIAVPELLLDTKAGITTILSIAAIGAVIALFEVALARQEAIFTSK